MLQTLEGSVFLEWVVLEGCCGGSCAVSSFKGRSFSPAGEVP
jgi:hypothetical protein